MFVYKIILFMFYLAVSQCRLPDKVYCVNKECSEPISKAKTLLSYNSGDSDLMSFRSNVEAIVYMKSAGTNPDLWYVKIGEQSGFVNSRFLRESKVFEKNPQFINPIEVRKKETQVPNVQPDKVQQAHEVFEGTTIYTTQSTSPELVSTTATPPVVTDGATPELSQTEEPAQTEEPPNDSELGDVEENNSVEQNVDREETTDNAEATQSVSSEILNQLDKDASEINDVQSEEDVIQKETSQALPTPLPVAVPEIPVPTVSENIKVPENFDNVLNMSPQTEPSVNNNINNYTPPSTVENTDNVPVAETTESTDTPLVPSDDNVQSQPQEELPQKTLAVQDTGLFSSLFGQESPNPTSNEQTNDNSETGTENRSDENTSQEVDSEELNNDIMDNTSIPSDPIPSDTITSGEELTDKTQVNIKSSLASQELSNEEINDDEISTMSVSPELSSVPDPIPASPPSFRETILPIILPQTIPPVNIPETQLPPSNEIPPIYEEPQNIPTTTETLPPIFNTPTEPTESVPQESSVPDVYSYSVSSDNKKDSEPNVNNEDSIPATEPPPLEDIYTTSLPPDSDNMNGATTEAPLSPEESSESFLSSMYSTLADVWPSSTKAPPSLFNTEAYPTFEEEKIDGKPSFSIMSYIMSSYYSVMGVNDDIKALFPSHGETCYTDEFCDGKGEQSNRFLTFLVTAASSVLLFTLGYYYIDNKRQDSKLIGQINSLQRDLLFSTKECEILKEELSTTKTKLAGIEDSSFGMDDMVLSLKEEINELNANNNRLRNSLDDNEKLLRVSENTAGELQSTLVEVENTLSELFSERANSEEQINDLNEKIQAFEEELISVSRDRDNYQLKYVSAETALEESKKYKKQLDDITHQLAEAKNTIELQKHEITALKDAIRELKGGDSANVDATSFIDHTEIKAKLSKALEEKHSLASKYEVEHTNRKQLSEELASTQESLRTTSQQATEALTRLEVLGKYFQEREGELLKELNAKESLWLSKQGESASTVEKIELMQQEVQRYKEKCDALTLELAEQESSRRTAVSEVESRAHSAWLEARAARREADAARDEAATLRRKLASLTAADGAVSPHHSECPTEVESRAHSAWLEARAARREADAARDEAATLRRKLASLTAADGAVSPHHSECPTEVESRAHSAWLEARAARREADAARDEAATLRRKLASLTAADGAVSPHHSECPTEVESRAHSAWLEARAARREADAARDEAATLRRKLASLTAADGAVSPHHSECPTEVESRAHSAWLEARAARREADAARDEAATLRRKLASLTAADGAVSPHHSECPTEVESRAHSAWLEARAARREADAARDEAATLRRKLASLTAADGAVSPHHSECPTEVESRAHSAWLEARAARREADAARDEAATLRRKLASLTAADGAVSPHHSECPTEVESRAHSAWLEARAARREADAARDEAATLRRKLASLTAADGAVSPHHSECPTEVESRAHSAWLEARAARREADAARDEAATLRRKLASLTAADGAVSPHHKVSSPLDLDGGVMPPPLPLAFLPPPLLPPLPRPPPLGRLPSPHPPRYGDRRYSPDPRYTPESRYSPETVRYSPDSRYSPRSRHDAYSPRSRRRYDEGRSSRTRNGPAADTETEYNSDSPTRAPRRRSTGYSRHSGPSSGSGYSSGSDK